MATYDFTFGGEEYSMQVGAEFLQRPERDQRIIAISLVEPTSPQLLYEQALIVQDAITYGLGDEGAGYGAAGLAAAGEITDPARTEDGKLKRFWEGALGSEHKGFTYPNALDPDFDWSSVTESARNEYNKTANEVRDRIEAGYMARPVLSSVSATAGSMTPAGLALKTGKMTGRHAEGMIDPRGTGPVEVAKTIGKGSTLGGASAAMYGYGSGEGGFPLEDEGSLNQRFGRAGEALPYGVAFGTAIPSILPVAQGTGYVAKRLADRIKGVKHTPQTTAEKEAVYQLAGKTIEQQQLESGRTNVATRGPRIPSTGDVDEMFVDSFDSPDAFRTALEESSGNRGLFGPEIRARALIDERQAGAAGRIGAELSGGTGIPKATKAATEATKEVLDAATNTAYTTARDAAPIPLGKKGSSLNRLFGSSGSSRRAKLSDIYGKKDGVSDTYNMALERSEHPTIQAPKTLDELLGGYRVITRNQSNTFRDAGWKITQKKTKGKTTYKAHRPEGAAHVDAALLVALQKKVGDEVAAAQKAGNSEAFATWTAINKEVTTVANKLHPEGKAARAAAEEAGNVSRSVERAATMADKATSAEDFVAAFDNLTSPGQQAQFRTSALPVLEKQILDMPPNKLLTTTEGAEVLSKVKKLYTDPIEYSRLLTRMAQEEKFAATQAAIGTRKVSRGQEIREVEGLKDKLQTAGRQAAELGFSLLFGTMRQLDRMIMRGRFIKDKTLKEEYFRVFTSTGAERAKYIKLISDKVDEMASTDRLIMQDFVNATLLFTGSVAEETMYDHPVLGLPLDLASETIGGLLR
jgi:hypothetical protein